MLDFPAINAAAIGHLLDLAREIDPGARVEGNEIVMLNPTRPDRTRGSFSLNRTSGVWKDHATGDGGGDLCSWWAYCRRTTNGEAAKSLASRFSVSTPAGRKADKPQKEVVLPVPSDAPAMRPECVRFDDEIPKRPPDWVWEYRDQAGQLLHFVFRWDLVGDKQAHGKSKHIRPVCLVRQDSSLRWKSTFPPPPRPLYGLHLLAENPSLPVLLVEGEKACDAARKLFGNALVVLTHSGGVSSAGMADWAPLKGRDVVLWPDADEAGSKLPGKVAVELKRHGVDLRVVDLPGNLPEKFDLADPWPSDWLPDTVAGLVQAAPKWGGQVAPKGPTPGHQKSPCTEFGLADRFLQQNQDRCIFDESRRMWLFFDGKRFDQSSGRVELLAQETIRNLQTELGSVSDEKRQGFLKFMMSSQRAATQAAVLTLARASVTINAAMLDTDPWLLNCQNGILDLRTGQLLAHSPGLRMAKIAGTRFDPSMPTPRWIRFIEQITSELGPDGTVSPRSALAKALQRAIGYALTGSVREQALWFFIGSGSNGKGVLLEILKTVLGDYAKVVPSSLLIAKDRDPHPADVATLVGVRLAIVQEVNKGATWDEAKLKSLTGADALTARFMHGNFFEFAPQHKFFVAANHRPSVRDTSHGFWRRLQVVPFDRRFEGEEKDPLLVEKLKAELPGILAWCVQGCLDWQAEGLAPAEPTREAVAAYRKEASDFGAFMEETFRPSQKAEGISAGDLRTAYSNWALENGAPLLSIKSFTPAVLEFGEANGWRITRKLSNGTWYLGFEFKPKTEATEATEVLPINRPLPMRVS